MRAYLDDIRGTPDGFHIRWYSYAEGVDWMTTQEGPNA